MTSQNEFPGNVMGDTFVEISNEIRRLADLKNQKVKIVKLMESSSNIARTNTEKLQAEVQSLELADQTLAAQDEFKDKQCHEMIMTSKKLKSSSVEVDAEMKRVEKIIAEKGSSFSEELTQQAIQTLDTIRVSMNQAEQVSMNATVKAQSANPVPDHGDVGGNSGTEEENNQDHETVEDMPPSRMLSSLPS